MTEELNVLEEFAQAHYTSGYDHRLDRDLVVQTNVFPEETIRTDYFTLYKNGVLKLRKGYCWDGATSCPDFKWIIRPSAVHDAGYQMIRLGLLPPETKVKWDMLLEQQCKEDILKTGKYKALVLTPFIFYAVMVFGKKATLAESSRVVHVSP